MLLAIDIGNTNITLGIFEGEKLKATWRIATRVHCMADEYAILLFDLLENRNLKAQEIKGAVLSSVVPPLISTFEEFCKRYLNLSPLVVAAGVKTGVRILMDNPREVGADRIVNALAAYRLYGGPIIVIDLGTAITFDAVSREGDYIGGVIAPGVSIATEALFLRTAMLPRVELASPKRAIGKNTITAMQSGLVYGYVGLIEGLVARIRQELGGEAKVVATGGFAELFANETRVIEEVNPNLTLIGLRLIYEMNQSR